MRQKDNTAGIYLIKHKPSGHLYVGQANDIKKRWRQHKKQLNAGTHHNNGLQKFWNGSNSEDFDFEIVILSPKGLSSLQLQRWLVKEERKIFLALKKEGVALNAVEPEIVATGDAVKEYKIEVKKSNKQWDKSISEQRHKIKEKIAEMENRVSPHRQRLYELRRLHSEKSNLIKKSTGWRRLFHGRPPGFNIDTERHALTVLTSEIDKVSLQVVSAEEEICRLKEEYRRLYNEFSKVIEKNHYRFPFFLPIIKPKIKE